MKSVQRNFGKMMKRSDDEVDVQVTLTEFRAVDAMLDKLIQDVKAWRNAWEDVLKLQYDASEAFANLYKQIEPLEPDMIHQPQQTPAKYMQKCLGLQKEYSDEKNELAQEIALINSRVLRPAEEAQQSTKLLFKTLKHRENMKLDYERYLSRAEHMRKKEIKSGKDEAALQAHEANYAQAQINYQTADEQVKQTFPPVNAAVVSLLPYLLANQVMLQTTLVGQLYTVLDAFTRRFGLPNPAPDDQQIVAAWDAEFTSFRKELENDIQVISRGKSVHLSMALPKDKTSGSVTGLGIRNRVGGVTKSSQNLPLRLGAGRASQESIAASSEHEDYSEPVPPKPPRPGGSSPMASPNINLGSKPRIPSVGGVSVQPNGTGMYGRRVSEAKPPPPYDYKPTALTPGYGTHDQKAGSATPPSRYQTPVSEVAPPSIHGLARVGSTSPMPMLSPVPSNSDYFGGAARRASQTSIASSAASVAAAAKKKPPPPVPAKRIPSMQQAQYVTALFDFEGQNAGDLAFREGDKIRVIKKTDSTDDWWDGELRGRTGAFPANYVQM